MTLSLPNTATSRIHHSFRRGLPSYHAAAVAQARIAALLVTALAAHAPTQISRAFEFGCGTGHLTAQLLQRFTIQHLTLNDLVAESADTLHQLLQGHSATFQPGPIETLPIPADLMLIASASTVQWVANPAALVARLANHLAPGGWLALSGFARGHFAELRGLGSQAKAPSYLDPQDWRAILPPGLEILTLAQHDIQVQFDDALSLLRHLRFTGVNASSHRHWTRATLADFTQRLHSSQKHMPQLTLTYCPVLMVAQKSL